MNMTEMAIQTQRQISSLNGRLKHERNMETDTNNFSVNAVNYIRRSEPHVYLVLC